MTKRTDRGLCEIYHEDPERADALVFGRITGPDRRGFLRGAGLGAMAAAIGAAIPHARTMPGGLIPAAFAETAEAFQIEGKHPGLILHNDRPLNMETPAHMMDDDITPSDVHFVRNNGTVPEPVDPAAWRLKVDGEVNEEIELSLDQLRTEFEPNGRASGSATSCAAPGSSPRRCIPAMRATTSISRSSPDGWRCRAAGRSTR